jgi:hypothetical protein
VRRKEGPLLTSLAIGDASSKLVEAYRLHPNAIKSLARCGQGYLLSNEGPGGLRDAAAADGRLPAAEEEAEGGEGPSPLQIFVVG